MFGFFKKKSTLPSLVPPNLPAQAPPSLPPSNSPGPRKVHHGFTHEFVPMAFITGEKRERYIMGLFGKDLLPMLKQTWRKVAAEFRDDASLAEQLELQTFGHKSCLCGVWTFPQARFSGESIAGLILAGPSESWTPQVSAKVPVRYFVLERVTDTTSTIKEWTPGGFVSAGAGPFVNRPMTEFCDMVFDRVFGKQRPTAQEAARRLLILQNLAVYSQTVPMGKQLHQSSGLSEAAKADMHRIMGGMFSKRLQALGLWDYVSPLEQEFFSSPVQNLPEQQVVNASWRREAIVPLMWALGLIVELPGYDSAVSEEILKQITSGEVSGFITSARLRDQNEIDRARKVAELWNWRNRTRQLMANGHRFEPVESLRQAGINSFEDVICMTAEMAFKEGDLPPPIVGDFPAKAKAYRDLTDEEWTEVRSVAVERHFALNWLCGYAPGNNWDSTPTDT